MRVSVVGSLLFSRFTAYLSPFSLVSFCNTEISEFFDMENSEQLFVARVPKILRNYCFYITKFKYHLCYYLNLFAILAKGTVR